MRRPFIGVTASLLFSFVAGWGVQGPDREPAAVSSLSRAAAALGAQPGRIRNALVTGEAIDLEGGVPPVPFAVLAEAGRLRWTFLLAEGERTVLVGEYSGVRSQGGKSESLGLNALSGLGTEMLPALGMSEWLGSGRRVQSSSVQDRADCGLIEVGADGAGIADEGARQAHRRSRRLQLCLRPSDGLLTGLRYFLHPGDWRIDIPAELRFSDWTEVEGTLWPAIITRYVEGRPSARFLLKSVDLNVAVTEADFAP